MNRKVVYNACYGGFGLSPLAIKRYYLAKHPETRLFFYKTEYLDGGQKATRIPGDDKSLKGLSSHRTEIRTKDFGEEFYVESISSSDESGFWSNKYYVSAYDIERDDPDLVRVVEELGDDASGDCAELAVADIGEEKYRIEEYDGWESVITPSTPYDWK